MAYNVRIVFSGLCLFAPNRPFDQSALPEEQRNPPDSAVVLLRQLLVPIRLSSGELMPVHIPRLEFHEKNRRAAASTRATDLTLRPGTGANERRLCILRFEDITFRPGGNASSNSLRPQVAVPADPTEPSNEAERSSLFWLSDLKRATDPQTTIKGSLFGELQPGAQSPLIGRIHLTEGTLQTQRLLRRFWTLHPDDTAHRIAESISLELTGLEEDLEIFFTDFSRTNEAKLVLGPETTNDGELVEIEIKNAELELFDSQIGPRVVREDIDFESYFGLCQIQQGTALHIPRTDNDTVLGIGGCTPATGDPGSGS